ncbi:MAG: hypothetical protein ACK5LK_06760 [Chthoniobacterales bacterium]
MKSTRPDIFTFYRVRFVVFAALSLLGTLLLGACFSLQDNRTATQDWLNAQAGTSQADISGTWKSERWGWANFRQSGNKITGQLGIYNVDGRSVGEKIYLALSDAGRTYYTSILSVENARELNGKISSALPFSDLKAQRIVLKKF